MKKMIEKILKNDIVVRCYKTFIQAFIGSFITIQMINVDNFTTFKKFILSCVITAVCAVMNVIIEILEKRK